MKLDRTLILTLMISTVVALANPLAATAEERFHVCPADPDAIDCLRNHHVCTEPEYAELIDYLNRKSPADQRTVLAFDHGRRIWAGGVWKPGDGRLDISGSAVVNRFDANCVPELAPGRKRAPLVVVYNTNPLLYGVDPAAVTEVDPASLALLQQLALRVGGLASAALASAAEFVPTADGARSFGLLRAQPFPSFVTAIRAMSLPFPEYPDLLDQIGDRVATAQPLAQSLSDGATELHKVGAVAEEVGSEVRTIQHAVEESREVPRLVQQITPLAGLTGRLTSAADTLARARSAATAATPGCVAGFEAAVQAIRYRRLGSDPKTRGDFQDHLDLLRTADRLTLDRCTGPGDAPPRETETLAALAGYLETWDPSQPGTRPWTKNTAYGAGIVVKPTSGWQPGDLLYRVATAGTSAAAEPQWPAAVGGTVQDGTVRWQAIANPDEAELGKLAELQRAAQIYVDIAGALADQDEPISKLLAAVPAAAKLTSQLEAHREREIRTIPSAQAGNLCPTSPCGPLARLSQGVIPVLEADPGLRWDKGQNRKFTIATAASAPGSGEVAKRRKEKVETEYRLRHRWFRDLAIGFGVTHSRIVEPTFGAVSLPAESADPGEGGMEEPVTPMAIARTDESRRTGVPALLLSYPILRTNRNSVAGLGVEVGAALDTDDPGFFAGLSLGFGRFVRLGVGWSWQQVSELRTGQVEASFNADGTIDTEAPLTMIASEMDIRTRDHFDDDYYISLTVTLNSLPLFKAE